MTPAWAGAAYRSPPPPATGSVFLLAARVLLAPAAGAQVGLVPGTLRVLGSATVTAPPDRAIVRPYSVGQGEAVCAPSGDPGAHAPGLSSVDAPVVVRFQLPPEGGDG